MCAVLNISTKTYYKYRNKEDSDYYDYLIIKEIFDESKGTYGYRRIVDGLILKYGVVMNGKKVLRIMKKYNLMAEYIRKSKKKNKNETPSKQHRQRIPRHAPHLLQGAATRRAARKGLDAVFLALA